MEQNNEVFITLHEDDLQDINGGFDFVSMIGGIIDMIGDHNAITRKP